VRQECRGTANQKRLRPLAGHCGEGALELLRTSCLHVLKANVQRSGGSFHVSHLKSKRWVCRVREDCHSGSVWDGLLQNVQVLAENLRTGREGRTGDVPPLADSGWRQALSRQDRLGRS